MIALRTSEIARVVGGSMPGHLPQARPVCPDLEPEVPFGVTGVSTDTRTLKPGDLFVALVGENFDGHCFVADAFDKGARAAIVAESGADVVDLSVRRQTPLILVDDTRAALARLATHHRNRLSATVIAVTGSNGKTTTKHMIDHVLGAGLPGRAAPRSFNNDIGVPLTLLSAEPSDRYLVVEVGSSAPGEVAHLAAIAAPDVGVMTSIGRAHLEGFGGISEVAREKLSLFDHVKPGGLRVANLDDLKKVEHGPLPGGLRTITYGTAAEADLRISRPQCRLDEVSFRINDRYQVRLPVPGAHNAMNAAAAFAVARWMELEPDEIIEALATVRLPDMRLNVRRLGVLTLIEDCYNANPTSMAAAVEVLRTVESGRRVLVAGDMMELGPDRDALHEQIGALATRSGIDLVVSVGAAAGLIVEGARSVSQSVATHAYETTEQACVELPGLLAKGDTVLVKGSRAVGMEKLARRIAECFSATGGTDRRVRVRASEAREPAKWTEGRGG